MMRALIVSLMALTLASCATVQKLDAANDVHALLLSIRDNDQMGFEAHVDRDALKRELGARLAASTVNDRKLGALAALLGPSVIDFAGDALIQPQVFRSVAEQYGYRPDMKIPNPVAITTVLKEMPDGRVCATRKKDGPCMLIFAKEGDTWKLTDFEGDASMLRLKL